MISTRALQVFAGAGTCLLIALSSAAIGFSPRGTSSGAFSQSAAAREIPAANQIEPKQWAEMLAQSKEKPAAVCVGFQFLYTSAHVPGAVYLGPARTDAGLDLLRKWAEKLPRNKMLLIYCGCCPWDNCPNIHPAFEALRKMGFTRIKVVHITQDFDKDWVEQGFPIEKGK